MANSRKEEEEEEEEQTCGKHAAFVSAVFAESHEAFLSLVEILFGFSGVYVNEQYFIKVYN